MSSQATAGEGLDVLVVGAGFGGLYMLHKARTLGLRALAVDAAPGVGGTWYHNRYPGARVDVQSLEYSYSFSEELQQAWHWNERYAARPELLRYANHVADRFALRDRIRLETRLVAARWDEALARWQATLRAADGSEQCLAARFMVMASGPLSTPYMPAFPGLERFKGRVLHTAAWPHEDQGAVDFSGQRVGVIGTGSSGVQVIPQIAKQARRLTVFQRTPAYVVPAHNGPLDAEWERRVKADYAGFRARSRAMRTGFGSEHPPHMKSALAASAEEREARFEARWRIGGFAFLGTFYDLMIDERANALAAEFVRGKIRSTVRDPEVAARLSPTYPIGCKRLCVDSAGYYETFNLPQVELVDVSGGGRPIEFITERGVVAGGREHELDALVLATGFDAVTGTLMRLPLQGRGGLRIQDKWAGGPLNYLGLGTAGFPNLFHVAGAGSTAAFTSVILSIEHHVDWIGDCITWLDTQGHKSIEAEEDAEAAWMAHMLELARHTVFLGCESWYLGANIPGKPRVFMALVGGFPAYAEQCAEVAANGYAGFRLR
ncbi:MAG: NAD(P)/FAD-dependent oxidoreductase [Burkholderiales bacterium]|nr:NAD(P)/FAD-dependent oxidoreductase [Burkholderiales bacterium]